MRKLVLSLVTVSILGSISLPAKADQANVQNSSQVSVQEGEFNTSIQQSSQEIRTNTSTLGNMRSGRGRSGGSSGNVQDLVQESLQRGYDNLNTQTTKQKIDTRSTYEERAPRRSSRDRRNHRRPKYDYYRSY